MNLAEKKYITVFSAILFVVFLFLLRSVNDVAATRFIDPERTVINERVLIEDVEDDVRKGVAVVVPADMTGVLSLSFSAMNRTESEYSCQLVLYNDSYSIIDGEEIILSTGEREYFANLDLYRNRTEAACFYCLIEPEPTKEIEFSDVNVEITDYRSGYGTAELTVFAVGVVCLAAMAVIFLVSLYGIAKETNIANLMKIDMKKPVTDWFKEHWEYFVLPVLILAGLLIIMKDVDLMRPIQIAHVSDDKAYFFHSMEILDGNISLTCDKAGGADGLEQFDIPNTDKFQILMIAIIGGLTKNPYLASNLFYVLCFFLVGYTACYTARKLGVGRFGSIVAGVLYAFSTFMLKRYYHLWLCAYFMIPMAVLVAVEAMTGKNAGKTEKARNIYYKGLIISFLCAFSDLYYAYFSCALFSIAAIYCIVSDDAAERLEHLKRNLSYIVMTVVGCFICIIPNLLYWHRNPINTDNDLYRRPVYQTEQYALRITQMFLPSDEHRIPLLRNITTCYEDSFSMQNMDIFFKKYFINENVSVALGVVAVIGVVLAFITLMQREKSVLAKCLSIQVVFILLIATAGGVSSLISVFANLPVRAYNRMSIVIMFCALILSVLFLEKMLTRIKNNVLVGLIYGIILVLGFFDQTYTIRQNKAFVNVEQFFQGIASYSESDGEQVVFALPYLDWPDKGNHLYLIGLTEGAGDKWSAPAPEGRNEARWQRFVNSLETVQMIDTIKACGYTGVYLDAESYRLEYDADVADIALKSLVSALGEPDVSDPVNSLYYWSLE